MKDALAAAVIVIACMISGAIVGYALHDRLPSDKRCRPILSVSTADGIR